MIHKIGQRVGAIAGADREGNVEVFGYGVYAGEEIPSEDVIFLGGKYIDIAPGVKNPKIILDNGKIVYGCECWGGSEEGVKSRIKQLEAEGKKIVFINVEDYRRKGLEMILKKK